MTNVVRYDDPQVSTQVAGIAGVTPNICSLTTDERYEIACYEAVEAFVSKRIKVTFIAVVEPLMHERVLIIVGFMRVDLDQDPYPPRTNLQVRMG